MISNDIRNKKIIEIKSLSDYTLFAKFEDGKSGVVNLKDDLELGVFRPLLELENFQKVKIGEYGRYIYWDIDVPDIEKPDASAGWLYSNIN